jgi:hypothetical protein
MSNNLLLVTFNVPPTIESLVVDSLLLLESANGFSSFPVFAHSHINDDLSLAEQVTGRQKKIRFQIYVHENELAVLLAQIKKSFAGSGIEYWVLPVLENGVI